jgi:putative nucleotidyltransferase with HDIG domain
MSAVARIYFTAVSAAAAAILVAAFSSTPDVLLELRLDFWGIVWCVGIGLVAEALALDFRIGVPGAPAKTSLAFLPFLCALTLFSVPAALTVIASVLLVSQFVFRRIDWWKALFNMSQGIVAAYCASVPYHLMVGPTMPTADYTLFFIGFAALAVTFFLTNMALNSVGVAVLRQVGVLAVFKSVIGPGGAHLVYDVLASPIALVPVLLYRDSAVTGMAVIMLPLLLIQYSYISNQQVIQRSKDLLRALVKAIETRDPYTSGHSLRVATLAKAIAEDLGLPSRKINHVEMAALLHDIGKIHAEFAHVLRKPSDLTPEERATIETHAAKGAALLQDIRSVPQEVVASVRHHHEWYNGAGYPDGLSGASIPLPARIIMLCDSIDAMLSDRPYRKALSVEVVRNEIERCSGTQFDPVVVRVVLEKNTLERAVALIITSSQSGIWEHAGWS